MYYDCSTDKLFVLSLQETLAMCENRVVLFDNKTQNQIKRAEQLRELLFEVNLVVEENDGKPYTNNLFKKFKVLPYLQLLICSIPFSIIPF